MKGNPGVDYPAERESVDVAAGSRDDLVQSFVDRVGDDSLVLTVGEDRDRLRVRLEPGESLELLWQGPSGMRVVPTELVAVRTGTRPTWEVRPTGPAASGQRRSAVRAPFTFPLTLRFDGAFVEATGVDLSEAGVRCWLPLASFPARAADAGGPGQTGPVLAERAAIAMTLRLGESAVECEGVVIRRREGEGERLELSIRFAGLDERREDVIRRRVFAELREQRARGIR
ncbi:PilZ domain-containing protein [Geodermatophilus sp. SYSU D00691]